MTRDELQKWLLEEAGELAPWSKEQAIEMGVDWFYPPSTSTGAAQVCPRGDHVLAVNIHSRRCTICAEDRRTSRSAARRSQSATYEQACPACCKPTPHSVAHGKCLFCYTTKGNPRRQGKARAIARDVGSAEYLAHCSACNKERPHSVGQGLCLVCYTTAGFPRKAHGRGRPASPRSAIMRECPDLVLSRRDAMAQGWIVFRTGEPCENGHRGWRYTGTSQCVECQKKRGA